VLTQAFLAEDKRADAQKEVDATRALAGQSQNRLARLQFDLALARVLLTSGQPELSLAQLERYLKMDARTDSLGSNAKPGWPLPNWRKSQDTARHREPN